MWTAQIISEQSRQEFGVPTTLPAFYFDCTEWDQGTAGFVGQCFLTLVTLHDALSRAIIWGQVVVVVVGFPGPIDLRLMLVADKTSLPAELYNTWIQSAPGSELEFKTSPWTLGYLPWVWRGLRVLKTSVQCASIALGLPLAFTSRPPARQERLRHPMHRLVYTQHCQTRYSRGGGIPAGSTF